MSNRASAAELLGLSRQGLYIKMRRFGIIENSASEDNDS
jgi:transcriptional regulator of acetoin/glycerol metabolism